MHNLPRRVDNDGPRPVNGRRMSQYGLEVVHCTYYSSEVVGNGWTRISKWNLISLKDVILEISHGIPPSAFRVPLYLLTHLLGSLAVTSFRASWPSCNSAFTLLKVSELEFYGNHERGIKICLCTSMLGLDG